MEKINRRLEWLDFGKGFTIFLVVVGHVLLGLFESNKFATYKETLLYFIQIIYIYHIPVFFALSGFVFKPTNSIRELPKLLNKKILIFVIPYIFYNILQFTLQNLGGNSVRFKPEISDLLNIWYKPLGVSWFLYTLLFIVMLYTLITTWVKNKVSVFLIAVVLYLYSLTIASEVYVIQKVALWGMFFVLGYLINSPKILAFFRNFSSHIIIMSTISIGIVLYMWFKNPQIFTISYGKPDLWGATFILSIPLAFAIYPKISTEKILSRHFVEAGKDSLIIYLLHATIVSVTRIILIKLGIGNIYIHIFVGIILGWFGSILAVQIIKKIPYLDFVFYPTKYIKIK